MIPGAPRLVKRLGNLVERLVHVRTASPVQPGERGHGANSPSERRRKRMAAGPRRMRFPSGSFAGLAPAVAGSPRQQSVRLFGRQSRHAGVYGGESCGNSIRRGSPHAFPSCRSREWACSLAIVPCAVRLALRHVRFSMMRRYRYGRAGNGRRFMLSRPGVSGMSEDVDPVRVWHSRRSLGRFATVSRRAGSDVERTTARR